MLTIHNTNAECILHNYFKDLLLKQNLQFCTILLKMYTKKFTQQTGNTINLYRNKT